MSKAHRCTCETDGFCQVCRNEEQCHDSNRDYCDLCEPVNNEYPPVHCHWCGCNITYQAQYTLGTNRDGNKVCGVNCLMRPASEAVKGRLQGWMVEAVVPVHLEAKNANDAFIDARKMLSRNGFAMTRALRIRKLGGG